MNNCKNCGLLPMAEFYKNKNNKTGLSSYCKSCDKDKVAAWRGSKNRRGPRGSSLSAEYRKNYLDEIRNVPCKDCGNCFPPVAMDFDHLPEHIKSFGIMRGWRWRNWELMLKEIEKCEIVC